MHFYSFTAAISASLLEMDLIGFKLQQVFIKQKYGGLNCTRWWEGDTISTLGSSEIGKIVYSDKNYQISYKQMLATLQENVCKKYQDTVLLWFGV